MIIRTLFVKAESLETAKFAHCKGSGGRRGKRSPKTRRPVAGYFSLDRNN
ncbi:hypothetical protein [Burkholderia ubonensis]|nr:hypothetical protein [Burkholderia ubonensis]